MAAISGMRVTCSLSKVICRARTAIFLPKATYSKKAPKAGGAKVGAGAAVSVKKHYEDIETDPVKLTTMLCGGNIMKEGPDPVLKEDHEYPDWLWELRTDRTPIPMEELDPDTKAYWRRVRRLELQRTSLFKGTNRKWKNY